jgi:hypothetical protein
MRQHWRELHSRQRTTKRSRLGLLLRMLMVLLLHHFKHAFETPVLPTKSLHARCSNARQLPKIDSFRFLFWGQEAPGFLFGQKDSAMGMPNYLGNTGKKGQF